MRGRTSTNGVMVKAKMLLKKRQEVVEIHNLKVYSKNEEGYLRNQLICSDLVS